MLRYCPVFVSRGAALLASQRSSSHSRCVNIISIRDKSYWHCKGSVPLISETAYEVLRKSAQRAGKTLAVRSVHQNLVKTYADYLEDIDALSAGLLSLGSEYGHGSLIGIMSPNVYEWAVVQFACAKIGAVLVNINPALQPSELEHALNLSRCSALVLGHPAYSPTDPYLTVLRLAPEINSGSTCNQLRLTNLPYLRRVITMGTEHRPGTTLIADIVENGDTDVCRSKSEELQTTLDADFPASIQFTSGTTGKPKGVVLTHHNLVNNAYTFGIRAGLRESDAILLNVPLVHIFGCVLGTLAATIQAANIVLPAPRFNAVAAMQAIEDCRCTVVYGTPTMYIDMLSHVKWNGSSTSLRKGVVGGTMVPEQLVRRVKQTFRLSLLEGYGSTEMSPLATFATPAAEGRLLQLAMDHVELKVVDANGRIVPFGERGELCARGYNVFSGYLSQPDKTAQVIKNGWYHSGDEATMNADGHISITGRLKDMIIRGGENIYPAEIEDFLLGLNEIKEVYAFGVPDPRLGQILQRRT